MSLPSLGFLVSFLSPWLFLSSQWPIADFCILPQPLNIEQHQNSVLIHHSSFIFTSLYADDSQVYISSDLSTPASLSAYSTLLVKCLQGHLQLNLSKIEVRMPPFPLKKKKQKHILHRVFPISFHDDSIFLADKTKTFRFIFDSSVSLNPHPLNPSEKSSSIHLKMYSKSRLLLGRRKGIFSYSSQ